MHQPLEDIKMITCHLGNGSSIAAINDGRVLDTSMGLTPLDGFMMGTRCGSLDPSVVTFIMEKEGLTPEQMDEILNKKSGLLGISGYSAKGKIVTSESQEFLVPYEAIQAEENGTEYVFLQKNGRAKKQYVTTGKEYEDGIAVTKGLSSGDLVLSNPLDIYEGQHLKETERIVMENA